MQQNSSITEHEKYFILPTVVDIFLQLKYKNAKTGSYLR